MHEASATRTSGTNLAERTRADLDPGLFHRQACHVRRRRDGHLPVLHGAYEFRRAIVENPSGVLTTTNADVQEFGRLRLGRDR